MSVRLDAQTLESMKGIALITGRSLSEIARGALETYVELHPLRQSERHSRESTLRLNKGVNSQESYQMVRLAKLLMEARDQAPEGDVVVRIHLFAIDHALDLQGVNLHELVKAAGVPKPYATEIRKGMRLAEYVRRK